MPKYYIPQISLRDIRNKSNILDIFTSNFNKQKSIQEIILSSNGYYLYENDKIIKYKIKENNHNIIENYIENYTLIGIDSYNKKIEEVFTIPFEHTKLVLEKIKFCVGTSKNFIVFEIVKNKIIDFYILSPKKIDETNIFFKNDVSSFIKMLICK
jgi:hypothetical protein